MRPIFRPELVNDPFGDPGLFVDFKFERRALLFDLGDLTALVPKKILRISDVFVSHTHMDHFFGFDRLLRICLGRHTGIRLYGPPGFAAQVAHKLAAYTWNLVENYPGDFVVDVWEVDSGWHARGARLRCHQRFQCEPLKARRLHDGVLLDEPGFRVRAAFLDHGTPCLGFAIEEKIHVNVWKNRLAELGLAVGPWLKELKDAVTRNAPDDTPVRAWWHDDEGEHERVLPLGALKAEVLQLVSGEKIGYVTDVAFHQDNVQRITALVANAAQLFIECVFLDQDADHAARKHHLTARQAGSIARAAGAKLVIPFHFSPRYADREAQLRGEIEAARAGPAPGQPS
ncbi:MAG: ribonuclease Z [Burkholderiaceae bacterium]|nr:ribonuclease Z [Burkholderiaceae bacterium]